MKKIIMMLMIFSTLAVSAQKKISEKTDTRKEWRSDYTPEQRATIKVKQMTLALDLNSSQQKKLEKVFLKNNSMHKNKSDWKNMTSDQKFNAKNESLDQRIETKKQIKEILTAEQYLKWEMQQSRSGKNHHKNNRARQLKNK